MGTRAPDDDRASAALLLAEGRSYRYVEQRTGIPRSTLHRWRTEDRTFRDTVKAAQVEIEDLASALLAASGGELLRRFRDAEALAAMDTPTLNRVFGTAADKLIALRRIETPQRVEVAPAARVLSPEELIRERRALLERLLDTAEEEGIGGRGYRGPGSPGGAP